MLKRSTSLVAIIFISGTLALIGVACSSDKQTKNQIESAPVNNATGAPTKKLPSSAFGQNKEHNKQIFTPSQPSQYELALDKADGALSISQSAQSPYDWQLVESQWTEAIALMQTLPNNSPDKAIAKTKIAQYQRYLLQARQKAHQTVKSNPDTTPTPEIPVILPQSPPEPLVESQPPSSVAALDQSVFQATIKRRIGGTPVIDVTFNGTSTVEMIVDTGASGTVLTQDTANALGIIAVAKAKANTASAKAVEFPIGYVDSIQVAGALVKDVPVAIAPDQVLETGLLGHDFFGNYDVTIKRDVVEFRPR